MELISGLIYNNGIEALFVGLTAAIIAQIIKFFLHLIVHRKVDFRVFTTTGGMPSSHSAVVTSLATMIGKSEGINSPIFGLAIIFAFVVMYDATGVRRAAGKQAKILNKIVNTPGLTKAQISEKLVETLGHTPIQVFVGALIGIVVGLLF